MIRKTVTTKKFAERLANGITTVSYTIIIEYWI